MKDSLDSFFLLLLFLDSILLFINRTGRNFLFKRHRLIGPESARRHKKTAGSLTRKVDNRRPTKKEPQHM